MLQSYGRAVLGLTGVYGVLNVRVRVELGLEKLESRREKLRLGYWRRIQVASRDRALLQSCSFEEAAGYREVGQGICKQI